MTKVVVAMSGGVDSSVAAALLLEQGYEVVGMMLRLWSEPGREDFNRCCTPDSMAQARRVAAKLDMPFYVVDARDVFREIVVQYFLDGYAAGGTPNPCLVCNRSIRWEYLLNHALALGADFMATGHYARTLRAEDGKMKLLRAVDGIKDQSYVLHVLNQEKLQRAMFPVGGYQKSEIRWIAGSYDFSAASRADSQDLCFLAGDDYRNFLKRNAPEMNQPGDIITRTGKFLGRHSGLAGFTIGQRKGLGIESPVPLYVLSKSVLSNELVVGVESELGVLELDVKAVNWVSGEAVSQPFRAMVKTRYTARPVPAEVIPLSKEEVNIHFEAPVRDATAGQAAVFYIDDEVIGGGLIM